jgi:hypothetical protein
VTERIPYYRVQPKNGRAYWCPTPSMRTLGFEVTALGTDGPEARAKALALTAKWRDARKRVPAARRPRARRRTRWYVYFLRAGDRIKIGVSWKPFSRLADLAGSAHASVSTVVIVPGTRADERRLHRLFDAYRTNGEWFKAAAPLLTTMARCAMTGVIADDPNGRFGTKIEREVESQKNSSTFSAGVESNRGAQKEALSI